MAENWLAAQSRDVLDYFFRNTDCPMLASGLNGEIFDVNQAFLKEMLYTYDEIVGDQHSESKPGSKGKTWIELSIADPDLNADMQAAKMLASGTETEYWVRKHYKPKGLPPTPVLLHVLRYPRSGSFQFFLVSVHFLTSTMDMALETKLDAIELRLHEKLQLILDADRLAVVTDQEKVAVSLCRTIQAYPRRSLAVLLVLGTLLLGDRLLDTVRSVVSVMIPTSITAPSE